MDELQRFLIAKRGSRRPAGRHGYLETVPQLDHRNAPQQAILFGKSQFMRHLGEAVDGVRKHEYAALARKARTPIILPADLGLLQRNLVARSVRQPAKPTDVAANCIRRALRRDDRGPSRRARCQKPTREQSLPQIRRGIEQ
jgi:hypothetical protein